MAGLGLAPVSLAAPSRLLLPLPPVFSAVVPLACLSPPPPASLTLFHMCCVRGSAPVGGGGGSLCVIGLVSFPLFLQISFPNPFLPIRSALITIVVPPEVCGGGDNMCCLLAEVFVSLFFLSSCFMFGWPAVCCVCDKGCLFICICFNGVF